MVFKHQCRIHIMSAKETLESICNIAEEMVSILPDNPKPDDLTEELYETLRGKCDELLRYRDRLRV